MTKNILTVIVSMVLCICLSVAAYAIDTPWLTIGPDGADTETSSPAEENADTTDVEEDSGHTTDALPSDTEGSIETDRKNSDNAGEALSTKSGCGSILGGYAVLACCLTALVCAIRTRKENE